MIVESAVIDSTHIGTKELNWFIDLGTSPITTNQNVTSKNIRCLYSTAMDTTLWSSTQKQNTRLVVACSHSTIHLRCCSALGIFSCIPHRGWRLNLLIYGFIVIWWLQRWDEKDSQVCGRWRRRGEGYWVDRVRVRDRRRRNSWNGWGVWMRRWVLLVKM